MNAGLFLIVFRNFFFRRAETLIFFKVDLHFFWIKLDKARVCTFGFEDVVLLHMVGDYVLTLRLCQKLDIVILKEIVESLF